MMNDILCSPQYERQQEINLNKVPEVTLYFWFIKVMCTTVGETAADYLNVNLNLGLTGTSIFTGFFLIIAIFFQFKSKKYIPSIYWITVMLISVFGTLVTDELTDKMGIPLESSTFVFSALLACTFIVWYICERTLSIHSIFTSRRESFYWLTIFFTFALGTAAGDLMAEGLGLGYATTGFIIASLIIIFVGGWKLKLNPVLSFWLIYILTRPLGASIGDFLSQPVKYGGIGLGATVTSVIFVAGILGFVLFLSITKKDVIGKEIEKDVQEAEHRGGIFQTIIVLSILLTSGIIAYKWRQTTLKTHINNYMTEDTSNAEKTSHIGSLSRFNKITEDTLFLVNKGKFSEAKSRIRDLEYEWDNAEATMKPRDPENWTKIDDKIDAVLRKLRAVQPNAKSQRLSLNELLSVLK